MLETILKLYFMAMAGDVRSPLPHLFGPPGCGKSSVIYEAAKLLGVNVHTINVARLSPLELEGVQMPHTSNEEMALKMLHSTFWTQLQDGDIVFLDEFLRGFPEVYNGLLDILTAREVAGLKLKKVFIIAASNSTVAYDKALEDRLLHIMVPDIRKKKTEKAKLGKRIVETLGLLPLMADSMEMQALIDSQIVPMYKILDQIGKGNGGAAPGTEGKSIRNLIGQVQLRHVETTELKELLDTNNKRALSVGKPQYVVLYTGRAVDPKYVKEAEGLTGNSRLTEIQAHNLAMNQQLLAMEQVRTQKKGGAADDAVDVDEDAIFG